MDSSSSTRDSTFPLPSSCSSDYLSLYYGETFKLRLLSARSQKCQAHPAPSLSFLPPSCSVNLSLPSLLLRLLQHDLPLPPLSLLPHHHFPFSNPSVNPSPLPFSLPRPSPSPSSVPTATLLVQPHGSPSSPKPFPLPLAFSTATPSPSLFPLVGRAREPSQPLGSELQYERSRETFATSSAEQREVWVHDGTESGLREV